MKEQLRIAVVIPCYRVKEKILEVIAGIGPEVDRVYVVDDCCPDQSGQYVRQNCNDHRVHVLSNTENLGVGGAVKQGYRQALDDMMDIVVKVDGDGQMDPRMIPQLITPITKGCADYCKGSRFYSLSSLQEMPRLRLFGNAVLSFVSKVSSGYWNVMDPTNGYTAVHTTALANLPLDKIHNRYFFESDMLFRLGTVRAVVKDIPMRAKYEDEHSNLSIGRVALQFPGLYLRCFFKRVFYNYFLRDFNGASLELVLGLLLIIFGIVWGSVNWWGSVQSSIPATTGTVMLAALPIILGFQLLLSAIHFDMSNIPRTPLQQQMMPEILAHE